MNRYLLTFAFIFSSFLVGTIASAKNINLYEQPKNEAKIVGVVDSEVGIIPIFTPKDSSWVKIADPRNGNVGWIKSTELTNASTNGFSFRVISTGSGPHDYQVVQFGMPQQMSSEQTQALLKQMKEKELRFQKDMQMMMQNLFDTSKLSMPTMPVVVPVVMVPEPAAVKPAVTPVNNTPIKK